MTDQTASRENAAVTAGNGHGGAAAETTPVGTSPVGPVEASPFAVARRLWDDIDQAFDRAFSRPWSGLFNRHQLAKRMEELEKETPFPTVEMIEKDGSVVVRADLPGMEKKDISVELTGDGVVITGERRSSREETENGYYRSERSYGSFYRYLPLPAGTVGEHAEASYNNGVLEVTVTTKKNGRKVSIS